MTFIDSADTGSMPHPTSMHFIHVRNGNAIITLIVPCVMQTSPDEASYAAHPCKFYYAMYTITQSDRTLPGNGTNLVGNGVHACRRCVCNGFNLSMERLPKIIVLP